MKIKEECVAKVKKRIADHDKLSNETLKYFFDNVTFDSDNFLCFKATGDDDYEPDDEGNVPVFTAKWYGSEAIVKWVKRYCEEGGRIIEYSLEGDGAVWSWEFDGKGRMRQLALKPLGKWI